MMSQLELALRELESATAAVAAVAVEDFAEAQAAMERRSWAIADLSALARAPLALGDQERDDAIRRIQLASTAADKAVQRFAEIRNQAAAEWNHWSRIYRALGASDSPKPSGIDFRA